MPSSMCIAIGNQDRIFSPNSTAPMTQNSQSVTARAEVRYGSWAASVRKADVAPE